MNDTNAYDVLTQYGIRKLSLHEMNDGFLSRSETTVLQYLPDIISDALYLHDLYAFTVEDCVSNGILGLLNALKGVVETYQYRTFIRVYMIQYAPELTDYFGAGINRTTAKTIEQIVFGKKRLDRLSYYDVFPISSYSSIRAYEDASHTIDCINHFIDQDNSVGIAPLVETNDDHLDCDSDMCHADAISLLKELISKLPDRERDCLTYRYGLNNAEPQTLEEFADKYGHTREWARQIEKKHLR